MKLGELAERLGCRLEGDGGIEIQRVSGIQDAGPGDITFVANNKYLGALEHTNASAVILREDAPAVARATLRTSEPYLAFARAVGIFAPAWRPAPGIHGLAAVASTARIAASASVGAFVVVGDDAVIGERTVIFPHVTIGRGARIDRADRLINVLADTMISPRLLVDAGGRELWSNAVLRRRLSLDPMHPIADLERHVCTDEDARVRFNEAWKNSIRGAVSDFEVVCEIGRAHV